MPAEGDLRIGEPYAGFVRDPRVQAAEICDNARKASAFRALSLAAYDLRNTADVKTGGTPWITMDKPILYYWAPCPTCSIATHYADEHGIELDLRDVEQEGPYNELLALGGDANNIPYFYDGEVLIEGNDAVMEHLKTLA